MLEQLHDGAEHTGGDESSGQDPLAFPLPREEPYEGQGDDDRSAESPHRERRLRKEDPTDHVPQTARSDPERDQELWGGVVASDRITQEQVATREAGWEQQQVPHRRNRVAEESRRGTSGGPRIQKIDRESEQREAEGRLLRADRDDRHQPDRPPWPTSPIPHMEDESEKQWRDVVRVDAPRRPAAG